MKRLVPVLAGIVWLALLGGGFAALHVHETTPGSSGTVANGQPENAKSRAELVLFAHPKCPCTSSSLDALARLDAAEWNTCAIRIVFVGPETADEKWWSGRNQTLAKSVPGTSIERDTGGRVATGYGVRTSGHFVLRAADGRLLFSGGITATRGSVTNRATLPTELSRLLADSPANPIRTPVLGCPLFDEGGGE